jgi:hypothetical protein
MRPKHSLDIATKFAIVSACSIEEVSALLREKIESFFQQPIHLSPPLRVHRNAPGIKTKNT